MLLKSNYKNLNGMLCSCSSTGFYPRFFSIQNDKTELIKKVSSNRKQWEQLRKESKDDSTQYYNTSIEKTLAHSGFGKSQSSKSRLGFKYLGMLQTISNSTSDEKLLSLLADISKYIDEFTPYELIDIGYFLTRINRPGCSQLVEPILHRFFSLQERYSCLNGIYFHRLLRTMFIFQDVTYRVWVYEIAQMVSHKHDHLLMRDLQLIIDDLSLFYDAAAQGALNLLEESVMSRVHELELYRLPLLIHALGRCGYNSINVAKAVHNVYLSNRGHTDYYSSHLIGLLLKGYSSFHFNPGTDFLADVWDNVKSKLKNVEFKYLSWIAESFLKLRWFDNISIILDELISKHNILSHLEFTDFITNCWSIQSHILSLEFRPYVVPGSIWQDIIHLEGDQVSEASPNSLSEDQNPKELVDTLYQYYKKLHSLITSEMPAKIYESTPPYRATQFELLTRLLDIYTNPRDFRIILPLRKYDAIYPVLKFPNCVEEFKEGEIGYLFSQMDHLSSSAFFGDQSDEVEKHGIREGKGSSLEPLHPILKQYIHSFFFRTPALAPRGLRLLIQGLARIHFEQREESEIDKDLLPNMKVKYYHRPLSRAIVREVYRKLACFNNDDLLVALFGMLVLNMFEFNISKQLVKQAIQMWTHQKKERTLLQEQSEMISLFFKTLQHNYPAVYSTLDTDDVHTLIL